MSDLLRRAILQGQGREPADLVLKGGRFLDLFTGDLVASDIAITGDRITGTFGTYSGMHEIDISGRIVVPGFIDTHLHVESSLVTPHEFDRCVLRHGVTTAICDPHEIANVLGAAGIRYFLHSAMAMVMDLRVKLSSCVPATHLETAGAALNGYLAAGIQTAHETTTADEAREKLSKGMHILIREGSVSKDLHALIPLITERNSAFIALCTDDRNPLDIAEEGHLDFMIRTAIAEGADSLAVYRAASISAARAFRLHDRGLIAPGWRADLAIIGDLASCRVLKVFSAGRIVTDELFAARPVVPPVGFGSVKASAVSVQDFQVRGSGSATPVIGVLSGKIVTDQFVRDLPSNAGEIQCDIAQDVIKVAVVERHGINGNIGRGFVHGFGLKQGAVGSTVGHDSHNICVVGVDDADMAIAVNHIREIGGGFVVVRDGKVLAELALPIAGLMSDQIFETVRTKLVGLRAAAKSLGTVLAEPFLQVAFLPLPVIPHLKISERGMIDVDKFCLISCPAAD